MAWLVDPTVAQIRPFPVTVELSNGLTKGCTVTDTMNREGKEGNVCVAVSGDREKLIRMHDKALEKFGTM